MKRLVHTVAKVIHLYANFKYKNAVAKMKDINSDKKEHVKKYKNGLRKHLKKSLELAEVNGKN